MAGFCCRLSAYAAAGVLVNWLAWVYCGMVLSSEGQKPAIHWGLWGLVEGLYPIGSPFGLLCRNARLLWGIVASSFGLLGFEGTCRKEEDWEDIGHWNRVGGLDSGLTC